MRKKPPARKKPKKPIADRTVRESVTTDIHFRVTASEHRRWAEAAKADGRTLANWMRFAAEERINNPPPVAGE